MNTLNSDSILCHIDNVPVEFVIDSGSSINAVTKEVWDELISKRANIFNKKHQCDRKFYAYANHDPLNVSAMFEAWISVSSTKPKSFAEFFVIDGARKSLLSRRTSEDLRILKIGIDVLHVNRDENKEATPPVGQFPKFPGIQLKLSIDHTIPPKKIAYLRIPSAMEQKVSKCTIFIRQSCFKAYILRFTINFKKCSKMTS